MVMLFIQKEGDLLCFDLISLTSGNASSIWQAANCIRSLILCLLVLSGESQC